MKTKLLLSVLFMNNSYSVSYSACSPKPTTVVIITAGAFVGAITSVLICANYGPCKNVITGSGGATYDIATATDLPNVAMACYALISAQTIGMLYQCFDRTNITMTTTALACNVTELGILKTQQSYVCGNMSMRNASMCYRETNECYDLYTLPVISCVLYNDAANAVTCGGQTAISIKDASFKRVLGIGTYVDRNVSTILSVMPHPVICMNVSYTANQSQALFGYIDKNSKLRCYNAHEMRTDHSLNVITTGVARDPSGQDSCKIGECRQYYQAFSATSSSSGYELSHFNRTGLMGYDALQYFASPPSDKITGEVTYRKMYSEQSATSMCSNEPAAYNAICRGNETGYAINYDTTVYKVKPSTLNRSSAASSVNIPNTIIVLMSTLIPAVLIPLIL